MTTHVFIVDVITFDIHLKYMFAGTGAKEKDVDFNGNKVSVLYPDNKHAAENCLVAMMADICRVRQGDLVVFYLQSSAGMEGKFYGIFQVEGEPFLDRVSTSQFLKDELNKNLTFRVRLKPYQVYPKGVTEWKALDEIKYISSPSQMQWSLIYRKLKGNRGNTMITIYESEQLVALIRRENENGYLPVSNSYCLNDGKISVSSKSYDYVGDCEFFDIRPRFVRKFIDGRAHESHLQMYILQQIGRNSVLDKALGVSADMIEWIGNEVSCGVGMQRIDIMLSLKIDEAQRIVMPIELKAAQVSEKAVHQMDRYINWIEQYYTPNRPSLIQPVILSKGGDDAFSYEMKSVFEEFNRKSSGRYLDLCYVEYNINNSEEIVFKRILY